MQQPSKPPWPQCCPVSHSRSSHPFCPACVMFQIHYVNFPEALVSWDNGLPLQAQFFTSLKVNSGVCSAPLHLDSFPPIDTPCAAQHIGTLTAACRCRDWCSLLLLPSFDVYTPVSPIWFLYDHEIPPQFDSYKVRPNTSYIIQHTLNPKLQTSSESLTRKLVIHRLSSTKDKRGIQMSSNPESPTLQCACNQGSF